MSIDRLKLYHGNATLVPNSEADIEMSDNEFAECLHLAGSSSSKEQQGGRTIGNQKREGKKEESEDDSEELGPSPPSRPTIVRPGQGTPEPEMACKRYPKTPKPRNQEQPTPR